MRYYHTVEALLPDLPGIGTGPVWARRSIRYVVIHHTWDPSQADWRGQRSMDGMLAYWLAEAKRRGYRNPLGGHVVVDPAGGIWLPFGDFAKPLNAASNLDANQHGIQIEVVGNLDSGHDTLDVRQRHAVVGLTAGLLVRFGLPVGAVRFHREFTTEKSCPGTSLNLLTFRDWVEGALPWARAELQ